MDDKDRQKLIRDRMRSVGEGLVSDSRLRDALTDDQANELLQWGMDRLQQDVEQTLHLSRLDVQPVLARRAEAIRRAMLLTNRLVASLSEEGGKAGRDEVVDFARAISEVDPRLVQAEEMAPLKSLARGVAARATGDTIFRQIMELIRMPQQPLLGEERPYLEKDEEE